MAKKPRKVHWERKRHTEAKHEVLHNYLEAWFPILATQANDLIVIDGFGGPGRYENGEKGSPLIMLDAYARRKERRKLGVRVHYFFIEGHEGRAAALRAEMEKRTGADDIKWRVIAGRYEDEFPKLLDELRSRWPKALPPIFAFIDPFGAGENKLQLTSSLLKLPRCEALIFVPISHLARFGDHPDFEATLTALYGNRDWAAAREISHFPTRKKFLVDLFQEKLKESCRWTRAFEIVPQGGGNSHFLFFGTSNRLGLTKMKTAMWELDPVAGQVFKDATNLDHPVLFEPEPNVEPLKRLLREHFGDRVFSIDEAEDFTLFETAFRHDAHLKTLVLAPAERAGAIEPFEPQPGRRKATFAEGTRMRFSIR